MLQMVSKQFALQMTRTESRLPSFCRVVRLLTLRQEVQCGHQPIVPKPRPTLRWSQHFTMLLELADAETSSKYIVRLAMADMLAIRCLPSGVSSSTSDQHEQQAPCVERYLQKPQ